MQIDSIKNPMSDLLLFMQTYENNGLDDDKFIRKCKNLCTNFTKLYLSVDSILNEKTSGFDYEKNELMRIQTIEYCYLKISTIWDLAYQIADDVLGYKKGNKYEKLEKSFEEYKRSYDFLSLSWYQDINKIRNRIVHGGVNIIPFYDNDEFAEEMIREKMGRWGLNRLSEYNAYAKKTLNLPLGESRDKYAKSRLSVTRFYEDACTITFKRKMIESIADKYSLSYEWLSENELSVPINEALISSSEQFYPEITKGGLDLRMSGPNEERTASILTFEFSNSCYEFCI